MAIAVAGCAHGGGEAADAGADASAVDAPRHVAADAAADAAVDVAGCAISSGVSPVLGGADALASYPAAQHVALAAMLGGDDAAIAWDAHALYVTMTSPAFANAYEPLHVYVEAGTALAAATPSQGKEYSGLVPQLPFTATHLIAARRISDSGTGGPYDAVFVPAAGWTTQQTVLAAGSDVFVSADQQTLSVEVAWSALGGCPTALRLAAHVVNGGAGTEWKDVIPATHTPWLVPGGGYYEIDLTAPPAVTGWTLH